MIVDTQTYLWQNLDQMGPHIGGYLRDRAAGPSELLDATPLMHEQAVDPIDYALVLGYRSNLLSAGVPTSLISNYVASNRNKLIGFAGLDPMEEGAFDQLKEVRNLGLCGVVISPAEQGFHPEHSAAMRIYEYCETERMPLIIQHGAFNPREVRLEYAQPVLLDPVARTFPNLRLMLSNCGHPFVDQTLNLVDKHAHVFANLGGLVNRPWQLYNTLVLAYQCEITDKLLFGSGFPMCTPDVAIETIYSIHRFAQGTTLPGVPRERLRNIIERDALDALGIAKPDGTANSATAKSGPAPMDIDDEPEALNISTTQADESNTSHGGDSI